MTLRRRLLLGLLLLTAVALAAGDFATWFELRSYLEDQVTSQVANVPNVIGHQGVALDDLLRELPNGSWAEVVDGTGVLYRSPSAAAPAIPAGTDSLQDPVGVSFDRPFDTSSVGGSGLRYKAIALPAVLTENGGGPLSPPVTEQVTLIVAIPLSGIQSTLRRLELIELLVTVAALVGLAAAGLAIIRLGLRPLEAMSETADSDREG